MPAIFSAMACSENKHRDKRQTAVASSERANIAISDRSSAKTVRRTLHPVV